MNNTELSIEDRIKLIERRELFSREARLRRWDEIAKSQRQLETIEKVVGFIAAATLIALIAVSILST